MSETPALAERFYGAGEERAVMDLPPGTYRLFCSLRPVSMTQRIVVR